MFRRLLQHRKSEETGTHDEKGFEVKLFLTVAENIENINRLMDAPSDLLVRQLQVHQQKYGIISIDGLVDKTLINDKIIKNMQAMKSREEYDQTTIHDILVNEVIANNELSTVRTLDDVILAVLSGDTALFIEGSTDVIIIGTKGWEKRSIEEPMTESVVRGPRDGFTESLRTNTVLIRRRIRDQNLRFESFKIGRRSKKDICLAFVDGIIHPEILKEVKRRLKTIDTDEAPESGFIEQMIEDSYLSPFPQHSATERPDKVSTALLQGKFAIFLDGTPFVLIAPTTFADHFQSPDDYYQRFPFGTFMRSLRYSAAFMAVFLPALYIALVSFHPGLIPSKLVFQIAATREGVPFPAVIEAFLMEITFELLREAGLRLPKMIGQTIGIVGGLVIGEAAVSAGIVSPIMVMVVSLTAISSFAIPSYELGISFRLIRFLAMFSAAVLGLFGIILVYIMINIHIANLKSYGVPYSAPFAPSIYRYWKDLILRAPLFMLSKRPALMQTEDKDRLRKDDQ